jgi:hypothetical protein
MRRDGFGRPNGELSDQQVPQFFKPLSKTVYGDRRINSDHNRTGEVDRLLRKCVLKPEGLTSNLGPMDHARAIGSPEAHHLDQHSRMTTRRIFFLGSSGGCVAFDTPCRVIMKWKLFFKGCDRALGSLLITEAY